MLECTLLLEQKGRSLLVVKLISNLKELYKGEDILNKHICIACISGITALLTDQDLLKTIQNNPLMLIIALVIAIIGAAYLFGYTIETVHLRLQAGITVLPEITTQPFRRVLGMILIMIVWSFYTMLFGGIVLLFAHKNTCDAAGARRCCFFIICDLCLYCLCKKFPNIRAYEYNSAVQIY